ncbi:hypothetical protein P8C59_004904 [Phyllachora maydis]|uniref:Uncharacterized protein n=1 Tax=Phyllachora maydis TaxID=1825666 RepID=A0AAD9I3A1_9PEZI|nr:hypothetical protein P8C59_004904 [Phyllachora maydis]
MLVRSVSYKRIKGVAALILTTIIVATTTTTGIDLAVKGLTVYNRVIEEGLLEEAKKQYPIARQPRRPIRRGAIGLRATTAITSTNKLLDDAEIP